MTQEDLIIRYINEFGSITPLDAFRDLGITKLATVVSRLKRQGFTFYQHLDFSYNRYGKMCHYMRYWLDFKQFMKDMEGIE